MHRSVPLRLTLMAVLVAPFIAQFARAEPAVEAANTNALRTTIVHPVDVSKLLPEAMVPKSWQTGAAVRANLTALPAVPDEAKRPGMEWGIVGAGIGFVRRF